MQRQVAMRAVVHIAEHPVAAAHEKGVGGAGRDRGEPPRPPVGDVGDGAERNRRHGATPPISQSSVQCASPTGSTESRD